MNKKNIANKFLLTVMAAARAKEIQKNQSIFEKPKNKPAVQALNEISSGIISDKIFDKYKNSL